MAQMNNPALQKSKTLWIGDTEAWMDEEYIASIFAATGTLAFLFFPYKYRNRLQC